MLHKEDTNMIDIMNIAVKTAVKAKVKDDVPVGAVITYDGKVIAKAYNQKEYKQCATKHAEIIAIERACKKLNSWHLDKCTLYCTMEPCMMCCGAILQSRIKKIFYLVKNEKFGCTELLKNSKIEVIQVDDNYKMKEMLNSFFKDKR